MAIEPPSAAQEVDRRMALIREWDETVDTVRQLNGFEDFLRPPRMESLLPAAADGPVVIINVSEWRCDALIVTVDGVRTCKLPKLTIATVNERVLEYLEAQGVVDKIEQAMRGGPETPDRDLAPFRDSVSNGREATLAKILAWLWDEIAEPVLTTLGFTGQPGCEVESWPRIWWCPTGALNLLPLHAAGYHGVTEDPPRTVLDRVVSSYTPTLRALLTARQPAANTNADNKRMLAVVVPSSEGEYPLAHVDREVAELVSRFGERSLVLARQDATWETVREQLPRHRWAHFACHGRQDLSEPSQGGLRLYDRTLTVADISTGQYGGEFAFLSACKTATGGAILPDEVITLATAMYFTGYRHVIGTLWSVYDRVAADVANEVYADLFAADVFEPHRSAYALHKAIIGLRDGGNALHAWTPFIHTGP